MQNNTFGTLPDHSQLLELIAAHGVPAFLEGVADALLTISNDETEAAKCQANEINQSACDYIADEINQILENWEETETDD